MDEKLNLKGFWVLLASHRSVYIHKPKLSQPFDVSKKEDVP